MTISRSHRLLRVFVSAPYSSDPEGNVARVLDFADELINSGFLPLVPHFWHVLHLRHPRPYKEWMELDDQLLLVADVMVRLPGESPGAEIETVRAAELGIPVVRLNGLSPIEDQIAEALR